MFYLLHFPDVESRCLWKAIEHIHTKTSMSGKMIFQKDLWERSQVSSLQLSGDIKKCNSYFLFQCQAITHHISYQSLISCSKTTLNWNNSRFSYWLNNTQTKMYNFYQIKVYMKSYMKFFQCFGEHNIVQIVSASNQLMTLNGIWNRLYCNKSN